MNYLLCKLKEVEDTLYFIGLFTLYCLPMIVVGAMYIFGFDGALIQMGFFFTIALVIFAMLLDRIIDDVEML